MLSVFLYKSRPIYVVLNVENRLEISVSLADNCSKRDGQVWDSPCPGMLGKHSNWGM
jgi:hypothetical protein